MLVKRAMTSNDTKVSSSGFIERSIMNPFTFIKVISIVTSYNFHYAMFYIMS